jgi:hypothetical protein
MFFQPGISIQGSHVWLVVDVWEKDIYESETAFVTAMEKEKTNGRP